MISSNLKDVVNNAKFLFSMHPAPWSFFDDGFSGYVVDANGGHILGGEPCEGRVSKEDEDIVALVDVINSLYVYIR